MQVRYGAALHPVLSVDGGGSGSLTNGAVYEVIDVQRGAAWTSLRIVADDGTPALFDARGFVTIDDSIPADWRIETTGDFLTLGPAEFLAPGFWEDYFDRNELALEMYARRQSGYLAAGQNYAPAMARLTMRNEAETLLCVFVEPLGEDFWVTPKNALHFTATASQDEVAVIWHEQGVSVWMNDADAYGFVVTTDAGDVVECGYRRPPDAFSARSEQSPDHAAQRARLQLTAYIAWMVTATIREWFPEEGWGVLDSSETPGGCWAHFSNIEMDGYKQLAPGRLVELTRETPGQDGYASRAVRVAPIAPTSGRNVQVRP